MFISSYIEVDQLAKLGKSIDTEKPIASMKIIFLPAVTALLLFAGTLLAGPESSKTDVAKTKLPTTPAELLEFISGTTWHLASGSGDYFGEGTLLFKDKGIVEHLHRDGVLFKKCWGVTSDMKVIWGGKFLRVCRFSEGFKTFVDSRNETSGRRVMHHDNQKSKVTTNK